METVTFWNLVAPSNEKQLATWDESMDYEQITCSVNPGHQRAGRRLTNLSVVLPNPPLADFTWTWRNECLIQDHVLDLFREEHVTGFDIKPVTARFKRATAHAPPRLWELVVTGWGGVAPERSGIRLDLKESCPVCGRLVYSSMSDSSQIIDVSQWDGSDIFMVWPLPRFIFVADRIAHLIGRHNLSGVRLSLPSAIKAVTPTLIPGRLSYTMPEVRAHELGDPLGIA